jgi:hypothetical protein
MEPNNPLQALPLLLLQLYVPKGQSGEDPDLSDALAKALVEAERMLKALRTRGEPTFDPPVRNTDGRWPEPSMALAGELMIAMGVLRVSPEAQERRDRQALAKLEAEIQLKALEVEMMRLQVIQQHGPGALDGLTQTAHQGTYLAGHQTWIEHKGDGRPYRFTLDGNPALRELLGCTRVALCDLLVCLREQWVEAPLDPQMYNHGEMLNEPPSALDKCLYTFLSTLLSCLPDVLCPPEAPPCLPGPAPEPCDFAVEEAC